MRRDAMSIILVLVVISLQVAESQERSGPFRLLDSTYWITQTTGLTGVTIKSISAVDENVCWFTGDVGIIYHTTDGGSTWLQSDPGVLDSGTVDLIEGINDDRALIGFSTPETSYIYLTSDGGTTWDRVFAQGGGHVRRLKMVNASKGLGVGDPVGAMWSVFETNDGGKSWSMMPSLPPQLNSEVGIFDFGTLDTSYIWFSSGAGRRYSSNTWGASWGFDPDSSHSGGVWLSCWNERYSGLFVGQTSAIAYGVSGYYQVSHPSPHPFLIELKKLLGVPGTREYWLQIDDRLYYTSNGGSTWPDSSPHLPDRPIFLFDIVTSGSAVSGWAIGAGDTLYRYSRYLTSVEDSSPSTPKGFTSLQNYPNPFNPKTHLRFAVPRAGVVSMIIFTVDGKEVATLADGIYLPGSYELEWAPVGLPSGVYYCRLEADGVTITTKLLLVR
jgi:hypothetical protein